MRAQDIAQDVFLKAFESFAQLRGNPAAAGWLKIVTRRATLNYLTRDRRRWRLFSELREDARIWSRSPTSRALLRLPTPCWRILMPRAVRD